MLKIRLQRIGRRNQPAYRAVVTDARSGPKSGRFIEILGSYEPKSGVISFDKERVLHWIAKGAQISGTVHNFLIDQKIIAGKKINVLPKKSAPKKEVPEVPSEEVIVKSEEAPTVEAQGSSGNTEAQNTEAPSEVAETSQENPQESASA